MKFLKLEILNLASLDNKEGETIDFESGPLGESTIFSIVGPTGSGKSTLLDAICLALYNRAPRYPRTKGAKNQSIEIYGERDKDEKNRLAPTDCRNILTRGRKTGFSKLTFLANNGNVYRAEWHVRFRTKNYDEASLCLYRIEDTTEGIKETEGEWADLPDIIGLEYDQFLRTVLIAQGSFANFLSAKEYERCELLEKLIGCGETYARLARDIRLNKEAAAVAYRDICSELEAVRAFILTDDRLAQTEADAERIENEEAALEKLVKETERQIKWYADDEELAKEITANAKAVEEARNALELMRPETDRLALRDALLPAIDMMKESRNLDSAIAALSKKISEAQTLSASMNERMSGQKQILEESAARSERAKKELAAIEPDIAEARKTKTLLTSQRNFVREKYISRLNSARELYEAGREIDGNTRETAKAEAALSKETEALEELKKKIDKGNADNAALVEKAVSALGSAQKEIEGIDAASLQKDNSEAESNYKDIERAIELADNIRNKKEESRTKSERLSAIDEENASIEKELTSADTKDLESEIDTLRKTYTLLTSENWALHRASLKEGSPCPLCGATTHPYNVTDANLDEAASRMQGLLNAKESELRKRVEFSNNLTTRRASNVSEKKVIEENIASIQAELAALATKMDTIRERIPDLPDTKESIKALLPLYEEKRIKTSDALSSFNNVQKEIKKLSDEKDRQIKAQGEYERKGLRLLEQAKAKLDTAATRLATLKAMSPGLLKLKDEKKEGHAAAADGWRSAHDILKGLKKTQKQMLGGEDPDKVEARLKKNVADADKDLAVATENVSKLKEETDALKGALQSQCQTLDSQRKELALKEEALSEWLEEYNIRSGEWPGILTDDVASMLEATDDWNTIREEKDKRTLRLVAARTSLRDSESRRASCQETKPESSLEELTSLLEETRGKSRKEELIGIRAILKNHHDAMRKLGSRADDLRRLEETYCDWKEIYDAIGPEGKTLRKIAQCYTLGFLIRHANAEIRKFNSRYELRQVRNSLGIRVIDHDRADDVRDTTSLSGGETFIVSLGLALGLSSLSSRNISFGNLFIDEGFGTLDPDTLATVIDSLAMLQSSQGKKVGVISHTDTMSERISTQIRIVKNGNTGSSHIEITA